MTSRFTTEQLHHTASQFKTLPAEIARRVPDESIGKSFISRDPRYFPADRNPCSRLASC
jgi:hypothetical protein